MIFKNREIYSDFTNVLEEQIQFKNEIDKESLKPKTLDKKRFMASSFSSLSIISQKEFTKLNVKIVIVC